MPKSGVRREVTMHNDEGTIHAWLDGELPPAEAAALEAHVATCAECAALVAEARGVIAASSRILSSLDDVPGGVIPVSRDVPPSLKIERAAAPAGARARRTWWRNPQFAAAATVVAMALGTWTVMRQEPEVTSARVALDESAPALVPQLMDSGALTRALPSAPTTEAPKARTAPAVPAPVVAAAPQPRAELALSAKSAERESANEVTTTERKAADAMAQGAGAAKPAPARASAEADEARRSRTRADMAASADSARVLGEVQAQVATPAAAPPASARQAPKSEAATLGGRAAVAAPGMRCFDVRRTTEAEQRGVPATVQLVEMAGPVVPGRTLKVVVSSGGAGWFWERAADGGVLLLRVSGTTIEYETRITGIGAQAAVGTERPCTGM